LGLDPTHLQEKKAYVKSEVYWMKPVVWGTQAERPAVRDWVTKPFIAITFIADTTRLLQS
jgi:hypothetical protein